MKTLFASFLISILLISCSKSLIDVQSIDEIKFRHFETQTKSSVALALPSSKVWITWSANYGYISSYGGGSHLELPCHILRLTPMDGMMAIESRQLIMLIGR